MLFNEVRKPLRVIKKQCIAIEGHFCTDYSVIIRLSSYELFCVCSFLLGQNTQQSMEPPSGKSTTVFVTLDGRLTSCRLFVYHVSPLYVVL